MTLDDIITRLEQKHKESSDVANGISIGNEERAVGATFAYNESIKLLKKFAVDHQRLSTHAVYTAIRHYQKQGHCEGTEYETLERAVEAMIKPHVPNYVRPTDD